MNIFNSLGSNYDLKFVLKSIFSIGNRSAKKRLINFLEKKYNGKTILLYKNREAIALSLKILDLPKNSFVAINSFTCFAVYKAVDKAGYFAETLDLDKSGNLTELNFSHETLQEAIKSNPKIKAVIVQNTLGYPCDIEKIEKLCKTNNLFLIEDLAHSISTAYKDGREAGTVGDFVCLSFSQDKIIDAVSGGSLIIRNKKYQSSFPQGLALRKINAADKLKDRCYPLFTYKIRKFYLFGFGKPIHFLLKKFNLLSKPMNSKFYENFDLPSWYCNLALYCFKNLDQNINHRRKIANVYDRILNPSIKINHVSKNISISSNLRYPILVKNRKSLIKNLKTQGIYVSDIWYDSVDQDLKNSKALADKMLNLPTHINISEEEAQTLAERINLWLKI